CPRRRCGRRDRNGAHRGRARPACPAVAPVRRGEEALGLALLHEPFRVCTSNSFAGTGHQECSLDHDLYLGCKRSDTGISDERGANSGAQLSGYSRWSAGWPPAHYPALLIMLSMLIGPAPPEISRMKPPAMARCSRLVVSW